MISSMELTTLSGILPVQPTDQPSSPLYVVIQVKFIPYRGKVVFPRVPIKLIDAGVHPLVDEHLISNCSSTADWSISFGTEERSPDVYNFLLVFVM